MWPKERTAFLIIHGIGEQNPFETLDLFTRKFLGVLIKNNQDKVISVKHKLKSHTGWIENYVSLVKEDQIECPIDFYEYYWAYKMERKITFKEIIDWLIKTSDGARKFYDENEKIVKEYEEKRNDAFTEGRFKSRWYLKHLGLFLRMLTFLKIPNIPYFEFVRPIVELCTKKAERIFIDYLGDAAIYTTIDVKSKHYVIRKSILDASVGLLEIIIMGIPLVYGVFFIFLQISATWGILIVFNPKTIAIGGNDVSN